MTTTTLQITRVNNMSDLRMLQYETFLSPFYMVARLNENEYAYYAREEQGSERAQRHIRRAAEQEHAGPAIQVFENERGRRRLITRNQKPQHLPLNSGVLVAG